MIQALKSIYTYFSELRWIEIPVGKKKKHFEMVKMLFSELSFFKMKVGGEMEESAQVSIDFFPIFGFMNMRLDLNFFFYQRKYCKMYRKFRLILLLFFASPPLPR